MFDENSEKIYNPGDVIASSDNSSLAETLVYVARGNAVVKVGKYDDKTIPEYQLR